MARLFLEGHDGAPADRNPNMSSRTCAALEHRTLTAGDVRRKEELLGYSATDDDFDEMNDNGDTFRTFIDKPSDSNYLDKLPPVTT